MIGIDTTFLVHLEIKEALEHARAHEWLRRVVLDGSDVIALAPQVLAEFIHVVTDPKRFQVPLNITDAIGKASFWWNAREVRRIYPTPESTKWFLEWLSKHTLGRKRLLDTQLAATYFAAGIRKFLSTNARDYSVFGEFDLVTY